MSDIVRCAVLAGAARGAGVRLPETFRDGEESSLVVAPNRRLWFLVTTREQDGRVSKVMPSEKTPSVEVEPGHETELVRFRATLRDPAVAVQESFSVCGFDDPAFVRRFGPPDGAASDAQMREWERKFQQKLEPIPRQHWHCDEVNYRITPRAAERSP